MSLFFEPRVGYFEQRRDRSLTALGREFPSGSQGDLFQQQAWAAYDDLKGRRFVRFALSAPLVFHVNDNVGLALGPDLWLDVLLGTLGYARTQVGASTTVYVSF